MSAFSSGSGSNFNKLFVVIPAAGKSERMGGSTPKIMMDVDGVPVIIRTLQTFQEFANKVEKKGIAVKIVVVTSEPLVFKIKSLLRNHSIRCVFNVIPGGASRTESVYRGIEAIEDSPFKPDDSDVVFIHDGARCLVDLETLEKCLEGAIKFDICAAAVPVKSTIKVTAPIEETPAEPAKPKINLVKHSDKPARASEKEEEPKYGDPIPMIGRPANSGSAAVRSRESIAGYESKDAPINKLMEMEKDNLPPLATAGIDKYVEPKPVPSPFKQIAEPQPVAPNYSTPVTKEPPKKMGLFAKTDALEVIDTPKRDQLMEVQTPQVFRYKKLLKCYEYAIKNNLEAPDDTALAEALNMDVHLIEGSYSNIKITTAEDIIMAEALVRQKNQ